MMNTNVTMWLFYEFIIFYDNMATGTSSGTWLSAGMWEFLSIQTEQWYTLDFNENHDNLLKNGWPLTLQLTCYKNKVLQLKVVWPWTLKSTFKLLQQIQHGLWPSNHCVTRFSLYNTHVISTNNMQQKKEICINLYDKTFFSNFRKM